MTVPAARENASWLEATARDAHDTINRLHVEAYAALVNAAERYAGELARRRTPPRHPQPRRGRR
ncbi:hypothetical protein [Amycolatopsis anabasis]|uniref:hypothetical protein n=1 Tax=Amycolatopsis anabasis TaxID=1840409 RepID=UPI00131D2B49|nr:hypothetical protein [Amycolatopsis anabasis]